MDNKITFSGPGPYDLPVAQSATVQTAGWADHTDNTVVLAFRVLADPSRLELVRITVPNNLALDLAGQIARAVAKAADEEP